MLDALLSIAGSIGQTLNTLFLGRFIGDAIARVSDDFKRNRATEKRLKQAAAEESGDDARSALPPQRRRVRM